MTASRSRLTRRVGTFLLALGFSLTSCQDRKGAPAASLLSKKDLSTWISRSASKNGEVLISPDLLLAARSAGISLPAPSEALDATSSPSRFWKLHRARNFRTVVISGAAPFHPLAEGLHSSPVWMLTDVSPWGYAFAPVLPQSGKNSWKIPSPEDLAAQFPDPTTRSEWIAGTASSLTALGLLQEASDLLGKRSGKDSPAILEARASLSAARGRWNDAEALAKEAIAGDSGRTAARIVLARALTESGRTVEALHEAEQLVRTREDQETLFLLARAANAAGDREAEIAALEKLVALGRRDHQQLGASLTYLGQAYGRAGRRGEAMRSLEEALRSPELDDPQREAVRQLLEHLKPESPPPAS